MLWTTQRSREEGYVSRLPGGATTRRVSGDGFPKVDTTAPVDAALWLLEHLYWIEGMQPPLLATWHARQQAGQV